jgi:hypothetical protein
MRAVVPHGSRVHKECDQFLGFSGIPALRSLSERAYGAADIRSEGSAQDSIQSDAKSSGQREKSRGFETAPNIVSRDLTTREAHQILNFGIDTCSMIRPFIHRLRSSEN